MLEIDGVSGRKFALVLSLLLWCTLSHRVIDRRGSDAHPPQVMVHLMDEIHPTYTSTHACRNRQRENGEERKREVRVGEREQEN